MRSFIFFCAIAISAVLISADVLSEHDGKLIENVQWFQKFHDCLMETGPCPGDIKKYTDIIPVYLKTACGSCSPKEKRLFIKHRNLVAELYPKMFADLKGKFAPKLG